MSSASDKREAFQHLLQQLQLTDDQIVTHFEHAEIEKVIVERQEKNGIFISYLKISYHTTYIINLPLS